MNKATIKTVGIASPTLGAVGWTFEGGDYPMTSMDGDKLLVAGWTLEELAQVEAEHREQQERELQELADSYERKVVDRISLTNKE